MPTICQYFGINGPVPFVDVEIDVDNRLYVDPHAIRLRHAPQPYADEAIECLDSFLSEVTACALSQNVNARRRGRGLLQNFHEPWQTRLGMAAEGFSGHGGARDVGSWIWGALTTDVEALVRVGALRQLEDLPLFVDGVDRDITSDITTRIIFEPLCHFTEMVLAQFPEFSSLGHTLRDREVQIWDTRVKEWSRKKFTLPVANGKPLLLVPTGWARSTLLMSAGRFYETSVLSFAQLEQAVRASNGKLLKTPKDVLKQQPSLKRGRSTNLLVTLRALEYEEDLIAVFKLFVASQLKMSDADDGASAA